MLDDFRRHYDLECQRLLPERISNSSLLCHLDEGRRNHLGNALTTLVNNLHSEIVRSYRAQRLGTATSGNAGPPSQLRQAPPRDIVPETAQTPSIGPMPQATPEHQPLSDSLLATPNALDAFLDYLYTTAPSGALDDLPLHFGNDPQVDISNLSNRPEGASLPSVRDPGPWDGFQYGPINNSRSGQSVLGGSPGPDSLSLQPHVTQSGRRDNAGWGDGNTLQDSGFLSGELNSGEEPWSWDDQDFQ